MKKYVLFAGVNGSGKTTLYETSDKMHNMYRINVDEIVRSIGNWTNLKDMTIASRIAVAEIRRCFAEGISFNQETALCGKTILKNIQKARALGYRIEMYYVGLESAEIAIQRVQERVLRGGHGISEEDVRRRYTESLEQLQIALSLCDYVEIYDNTSFFIKLGVYENGKWTEKRQNIPNWCKTVMK